MGTSSVHNPNWARNARILEMRRAGKWPREIAAEMGLSRNIVIGVCNRAGLSDSENRKLPGAFARGEGVAKSKLTEAQVREIREGYDSGLHQRTLAEKYGVGQSCIANIVNRDTWKHI